EALEGKGWGVRIGEGPKAEWVGVTSGSSAAAVPVFTAKSHEVWFRLVGTGEDGREVTNSWGGPTRTRGRVAARFAFIETGEPPRLGPCWLEEDALAPTGLDVAKLRRLDLVCEWRAPGREPVVRRREIFTREFEDFPANVSSEHRFSIYVTTGWVPEWAREREFARGEKLESAWMTLHHRIAFAFLARSDAQARRLAKEMGVRAWFDAPRITIVSSERQGEIDVVSLDLRKNDIHVEGTDEQRIAYNTARSLYDGALESQILEEATGKSAVSAIDLLTNAWESRAATLAERQLVLRRALARLRAEGAEGAALRVFRDGKPGLGVGFTKQGEKLAAAAFGAETGGGPAVLDASYTDTAKAAQDTELWLAGMHGTPDPKELVLDFSFGLDFELREPPRAHWYLDCRQFNSNFEKKLVFERQVRSLEPEVRIDSLDYYDDVKQAWNARPHPVKAVTLREDLERADVWTTWYFGDGRAQPGCTCDMISRNALRLLKADGSTLLRHKHLDGSISEPVRLFVMERLPFKFTLNGRDFEVNVLQLWGDFEKEKPEKPKKGEAWKVLKEPNGQQFNQLIVLDDDEYPFVMYWNTFAQSAVTGRVTDAATGRGVGEARIEVREAGVSTATWPGGTFALPVIAKPFAEFEVAVEAAGYKPFRARLDFRLADTFPLALKLEPLPRQVEFTWLTKDDAEAKLVGLGLDEHSKRLIRDALAERPGLAVCVPGFAVFADWGPADAWFEVDVATGEVYGRLSDGLYGSTIGGWARSKATPSPYALQHQAISYFSGRIAAWYLFAAGAIDAVGANMENPAMTMKDMHRHAVARMREFAKMYDGWALSVPGNPVVKNAAFKKGLKDGMEWAEKFYGEAWN
ncbi:MAG: carboxypeptidase regulatory-like domain-containing protein, partial [Planctomycetes bacterium]|nr:carboxypeptidase regulatory-like domain-containing protein [Planctomycetota bacterium]